MSQQPPEDWRARFRALKAKVDAKLARVQPTARVSKRCYKGHLYTPETTGQRIKSGVAVRKCLTCEAERKRQRPGPIKCGTGYAYIRHKAAGEDCDKCRAIKAQLQREYRKRKARKEAANGAT